MQGSHKHNHSVCPAFAVKSQSLTLTKMCSVEICSPSTLHLSRQCQRKIMGLVLVGFLIQLLRFQEENCILQHES